MTFEIRPVDKDNFDSFIKLIIALADYEKLEPPSEEAKARLKKHCLSNTPKYHAFLGYTNDLPVSYIMYYFTYSSFLAKPTLYLEDIFVLETHRKKGYGKMLFNHLLKVAEKEECGRMEWCVLDWNTKAINFYEKLGARPLSEWHYYRLTEDKIRDLNG